ncbi:glycoside hydrolase family 32 protein [Phocicoccus pinnipedialis]|uniref:Sucrose-6-phosphate hydrolase n=1 Tax=Phocicoccus pinnipedialis TaxID=110845 RepID=A0A6V7R9X2_9BACL|nr:sucrose-6-phosphate hydrolase [Jeotgalicoccus pinnipedialis]MBP1940135.1 beta-fructofuranosidase [Jeotgalicoccus pinnipedialis]CAD2073695.1 Sucrose-6-phosphate hydrolase [Jeotgalicoccus pinnipedialis]
MQRLEHIDSDILDKKVKEAMHSPYRLNYHVQPVIGTMGAPCGFCYINGLYHLFYEWQPTTENTSVTYLYHVTSKDLVEFQNEGVKVRPNDLYDSYNIYGGSLAVVDNVLTLFYTGIQEKSGEYITHQLAGVVDTGFRVQKIPAPIIRGIHSKYNTYFRNPFVFTEGSEVNLMLGTMNDSEFGRAVMYRGDSIETLELLGELNTGYDMFGYFWESPEIFPIDDVAVMIINPRGLDKFKNNFWNIYQSGYMVNDFEYNSLFVDHDDFHEFDNGFDFYRPITTLDENNKRIMIASMSAHESVYPTEKDGVKNALTIPRVLTIKEDRIIQTPHPNLEKLRSEPITALGYFDQYPKKIADFYGDQYELNIKLKEVATDKLSFLLRKSRREETIIQYNAEKQTVILDRTFSGEEINEVDGTTRTVQLLRPLENLRIFMDKTSIEVFLNDGEHTMTARIFPSEDAVGVELMTESGNCLVEMTYYKLSSTHESPIITSRDKT